MSGGAPRAGTKTHLRQWPVPEKTLDTLPPCHHDGAINKAAILLETGTHGSRINRAQGHLKSRETVAPHIDFVRGCLGRPARLPAFLAGFLTPPTRSGDIPKLRDLRNWCSNIPFVQRSNARASGDWFRRILSEVRWRHCSRLREPGGTQRGNNCRALPGWKR